MSAKVYGKFYSPERVLSYGRPWIFSIGSRSIGKSTGWAIWMIKNYLKTGEHFLYIRRTENELKLTRRDFFNNAIEILRRNGEKIEGFKFDAGSYFIKMEGKEWEECGSAFSLNLQRQKKSANMGNVGIILYDEFMTRRGGYLGSEADPLREATEALSLYGTVARDIGESFKSTVKFVFCGNNESYYNPLFIYLGIDKYITTESKYLAPKGKPWIVEQTAEVEATKEGNASVLYQLMNEREREYTFSNIPVDSKQEFVETFKGNKVGIGNLKYAGNVYGLWVCNTKERGTFLYISTERTERATLALTYEDQSAVDYMAVTMYSRNPLLVQLRQFYDMGRVWFSNNRAKIDICTFLKLT